MYLFKIKKGNFSGVKTLKFGIRRHFCLMFQHYAQEGSHRVCPKKINDFSLTISLVKFAFAAFCRNSENIFSTDASFLNVSKKAQIC